MCSRVEVSGRRDRAQMPSQQAWSQSQPTHGALTHFRVTPALLATLLQRLNSRQLGGCSRGGGSRLGGSRPRLGRLLP